MARLDELNKVEFKTKGLIHNITGYMGDKKDEKVIKET